MSQSPVVFNFHEDALALQKTTDNKTRLRLANKFREHIEIVHTTEFEAFLKDTFHVFLDVLRQTSVQFVDGDEQKIRNVLLEILNRLPNLEVMGNYVNNLANVVMHILDNDNEDNAIICLKIIFEIHKVFSSKLEAQVQPFINFFKKFYYMFSFSVDVAFREKYKAPNGRAVANLEFANIQSEIEKANKEGNLEKVQLCHEHRTAINNAYLDQNSKNPEQKRLTRSLHSFKVLRECPLIVMLLFQLHPQFVEQNIRDLIPVMIKALQQGRGDEGIQNPPAKKELYTDFISAQVKTLSFLTYVLRGFAQRMEPHKDILPDCVIRLLRNCPADAINCRKELLVATRHILATEFRQGFMSKIDTLTDENILIGPGTKPETVRALAYSTVSDLINHVRQTLSLPQLNKVVDIFSKNIHDATLSLRIQTASVRLILNLVDFISRKQEPGGRSLLVRILSAFVNKFEALRDLLPKVVLAVKKREERIRIEQEKESKEAKQSGRPLTMNMTDLPSEEQTWTIAYTPRTEEDFPEDSVRDIKELMYNMVFGLKTVTWCITGRNSNPRQYFMEEDECRMVASLLEYGLKCCEVYLIPTPSADRPYTDKDILELFANIFTVLDPRCFREVLNAKMDFLFQQLCTHHNKKLPISIIPQQFLNSSRTSMSFADILLSFLTEKMDLMAGSSDVGAVMLQLFSISFRSVTDFPDNEGVLRPYMNKIVTRVMHLAKKVLEPMNYFSLLRALFRAIGGGKFEQLYKEFGPLLPELLNGLMEIQRRGPSDIRDICVELCLTVPARLSSLLPHIPLLMNAVLLAIQAQDDQVVKLGLRTIDFWVDNLNPEYLYPHMCVVLSDLMRNLCLLLSSNTTSSANAQTALSIITKTSSTPSAFGLTALTVLGKLGGRNRRFLAESFNLTAREHAGHGMLVAMRMLPRHEFVLALDDILPYTIKFLTNLKTKDSVRVDSFQFARFCLLSMIDLRGDVRTMVCSLSKEDKKTEQTFKGIAEIAVGRSDQRTASREAKRVQARLTTAAQLQVFGQLVAVIVNAGADPVLSSVDAGNSRVFALGLSRHFALHSCLPSERAPDRVFDRTEIHSALFLDALMKVLFDESTARFDMALKCLKEFVETLITMLGKQVAGTLPIVNHLLDSLSHACCENKHEHARAGSNGLFLLCQLLGASWMRSKASELLPALFGSFSSNSYELAQQTFFRSRTTISWIINSCFYQNIGESIASDVNVGDCTVKPGCSTSSNPMDADSHSTDESWFPTIMDKVIETLVMQLISTAPEARRVAQDQLKIIQHHSNQTRQVATMVRPYLERLLNFNSAHQNLSQRIAHTSAASFCLQFKDLCSTNEPALHRLLEESLAELEKPDRPNDSERHSEMPNTLPGRISYINLLTEMKVESIIFLKFALKSELFPFCSSIPVVPDIKQQFKQNIIRQWFEKLMHVSEEIFQEAKQALKGIIDEEQIPKELLQQCLRPVLLKLSDIRLLSLSLMEKLYRLVELLSSCFASTLIDKLLDHLKIFATQRVELQYGIDNEGKATIPPDDPVKVAARIISLFSPLLPSSSEFLVPLVDRALDLEKKFDENEHFRGGYLAGPSSPFRKPLMDYLNGNGMPNGNIMPKKTVEWFMQELMNPKYSQLFHSILRAPEAAPLRRYIMEEPESLITWTFDRKNQRPADIQHNYAQAALVDDSQLQGTKIVHIITSFHPEWLAQAHCNRVVDCLLEMWEAPNRREREEKNVHEARLIVECLIRYSRAFRVARSTEESFPCPVLWGMLNVFLTRSLVDYSFLEDFYKIEVAQGYAAQDKSFILRDFVSFFEDKKVVQLLKVKALNLIIIPMLEHTFKSSTSASIASESKSELAVDEINSVTDVVSDKTLDLIVKKLLGCDHSAFEENLRIELLRLFSLLIEHMHEKLSPHKKDLIKFAWVDLKSDNPHSKHWASVNVCWFISVYETPHKIVLQVYVSLLRAFQIEDRNLVLNALGILMPSLHKKLPQGEHRYPAWVKWTKKIIVEEGYHQPQLIHIWNLIIRHPDLFYSSRNQFVPLMVNSLNRIGLPASRPVDNRKLALDLADLIITWDRKHTQLERKRNSCEQPATAKEELGNKRQCLSQSTRPGASRPTSSDFPFGAEGHSSEDQPMVQEASGDPSHIFVNGDANALARSTPATQRGDRSDSDFSPAPVMVELVVQFLIRLGLMTCTEPANIILYRRCVKLLREAMEQWSGLLKDDNMVKIDKILANAKPPTGTHPPDLLVSSLLMLNILIDHQPPAFISHNIQSLSSIMKQCASFYLHQDIREGLYEMLTKILVHFPEESKKGSFAIARNTEDFKNFYKGMKESILKALKDCDKNVLPLHLGYLAVLADSNPKYIDTSMRENNSMLSHLVKAIMKLGREYIAKPDKRQRETQHATEEKHRVLMSETLVKGIDLINRRTVNLGDQRKPYFGILSNLIEKSNDIQILRPLTATLSTWILGAGDKTTPKAFSDKERVSLMLKMTRYEKLGDPELYNMFLDLVHSLFTTGSGRNDSFLGKIQKCFMISLRCPDPKYRKRFVDIFHKNIQSSLAARLEYIFALDWESLSESFWLTQALDLLLTTAAYEDPISTAPQMSSLPPLSTGPTPRHRNSAKRTINGSILRSSMLDVASEPMDVDECSAKPQLTSPASSPNLSSNSQNARKILETHATFLASMQDFNLGHLIESMRGLSHHSAEFASALWVALFPIALAKLDAEDQSMLSRPIALLLYKDWHWKQRRTPNVIQALLQGLSKCHPPPVDLSPDLLKYLAKQHNAWHQASTILEKSVKLLPRDLMNQTSVERSAALAAYQSLGEIYTLLDEKDILYGLWQRRVQSPYSRSALSLQQYGHWQAAQDMFFQAMCLQKEPGRSQQLFRTETIMWQEEWIRCAQLLNQWECLATLSAKNNQPALQLESCWRTAQPEWNTLKDLIGKHNAGDLNSAFYQLYVTLTSDRKNTDFDKSYKLCWQTALQEWQALPSFVGNAHVHLFQAFHRIVELNESFNMLSEINQRSRQSQPINFKNHINTWRERLPNDWEDMPVWNDLLLWRTALFNMTDASPASGEPREASQGNKPLVSDGPWTIIRFAQAARKQNLVNVSLESLSKLYRTNNNGTQKTMIDSQEGFLKLREQIKICGMSSQSQQACESEYWAGLKMISQFNLEFCNRPENKAELFRLKGELEQNIVVRTDEANKSFSNCISICDTYGKGWFSWGEFCERFMHTKRKDDEKTNKSPQERDKNTSIWAEHAMICYLRAVFFKNKNHRSRQMLGRVLWLLTKHRPNNDQLLLSFDRYAELLAPWVWLLWLPQLLTSLSRPEAPSITKILNKIAATYPQSHLFGALRAMRERSEGDGQDSVGQGENMADGDISEIEPKQESKSTEMNYGISQHSLETSSFGTSESYSTFPVQADTEMYETPVNLTNSESFGQEYTGHSLSNENHSEAGSYDSKYELNESSSYAAMQMQQVTMSQQQLNQLHSQPHASHVVGQNDASHALQPHSSNHISIDPSLQYQQHTYPPLEQSFSATASQYQSYDQYSQTGLSFQGQLGSGQQGYITQPESNQGQEVGYSTGYGFPVFDSSSADTTQVHSLYTNPQPTGVNFDNSQGLYGNASTNSTGYNLHGSTDSHPYGGASNDTQPTSEAPAVSSSVHIEEIMNTFKTRQPHLISALTKIMDECASFKALPEENLWTTLYALLNKCINSPVTASDAAPPDVIQRLTTVYEYYLNPTNVTAALASEYKQAFYDDFLSSTEDSPLSLMEIILMLKRWLTHLLYRVGRSSSLRLEKLSPYLARLDSLDVEIPGQYLKDQEPKPETNVILQSFEPTVAVQHRYEMSPRRIGMRGLDGSTKYFLVDFGDRFKNRREERMQQMLIVLNQLMEGCKDTRSRNMSFHLPGLVPLNPMVRLMETHPSHVTLREVFEQSCAQRGTDVDEPALAWRGLMRQGQTPDNKIDDSDRRRLDVFTKITNYQVPEYVLAQYINKCVRSPDQLWAFKTTFASQLALNSYLSYLLAVGDRNLDTLTFFKHSARISNINFQYKFHDQSNVVHNNETVPFRLTRNLKAFLDPFLIDGTFTCCMRSANACLRVQRNYNCLLNYLNLHFRDELQSRVNKRKFNSSLVPEQWERLEKKVEDNVNNVLRRTKQLIESKRTNYANPIKLEAPVSALAGSLASLPGSVPTPLPPPSSEPSQALDVKVSELINLATDLKNVALMPPTWAPWF